MTLQIPVHVTAFYTALAALWLLGLALWVVQLRRRYGIGLGDGGHRDLQAAMRIHANAAETLPLGLLVLLVLELMAGPAWALHAIGAALLAGRVLHWAGLRRTRGASWERTLGMGLGFAAYLGGAAGLLLEALLL